MSFILTSHKQINKNLFTQTITNQQPNKLIKQPDKHFLKQIPLEKYHKFLKEYQIIT